MCLPPTLCSSLFARTIGPEMTLHQLRIFLAVAQSASLTRAGKQLGLAQPSLSQQLARLEDSLGTRLFDRGRNRMELTDPGRVLLRHALGIIREVNEAEVRIGAQIVRCDGFARQLVFRDDDAGGAAPVGRGRVLRS